MNELKQKLPIGTTLRKAQLPSGKRDRAPELIRGSQGGRMPLARRLRDIKK